MSISSSVYPLYCGWIFGKFPTWEYGGQVAVNVLAHALWRAGVGVSVGGFHPVVVRSVVGN